MRGVGIERFGGPEELALRDDWPCPEPGAGAPHPHAHLAGVNFIDVYMRSGQYARSQTYRTPLRM